MTDEIKPCPFCRGSSNVRMRYTGTHPSDKTKGYRVRCNLCGAEGQELPTKELAIEAWNRRDGSNE